jgi:hypothetical protein
MADPQTRDEFIKFYRTRYPNSRATDDDIIVGYAEQAHDRGILHLYPDLQKAHPQFQLKLNNQTASSATPNKAITSPLSTVAPKDLATGAVMHGLYVSSIGAVTALVIFKLLLPKRNKGSRTASGLRYATWSICASTLLTFGQAILDPSINSFAIWLFASLAFGLLGFLAGSICYRPSKPKNSSELQRGPTSLSGINPEARRILEVRLASGEISVEQFREALTALDASAKPTKAP